MSWQKQIGTRFELQVKNRFNKLAKAKASPLTAVRIWYSGAGDREPFDVGVYSGEVRRENLVLQIEAKRTQGRSLGVEWKWLEKVSNDHVIVFAVGLRNPVPPYVICPVRHRDEKAANVFTMRAGAKSVSIHERWVRQAKLPCCMVQARDRLFDVVDFETWVGDWMPKLTKEA